MGEVIRQELQEEQEVAGTVWRQRRRPAMKRKYRRETREAQEQLEISP